VVDRSPQGDLLRLNFNVSFPSLPCEFASLDVSDALGTVRPGAVRARSLPPLAGLSSAPLGAWTRGAPRALRSRSPGHAPRVRPQQARHGAVRAAHAPRTSSASHADHSRPARRARRSA